MTSFFNFLLSLAANLHMFLVNLEVKSKLIDYKKFRFETTAQA